MAATPAPLLPNLRQLLARVHLRLILFAVSLAAASMVVSGVIVIRNHAHRNLELIARTVGYSVEPAVVFDDRQAIREAMVPVVALAGVGRVEVRSPAGSILAAWDPPRSGPCVLAAPDGAPGRARRRDDRRGPG
jgi:hypothetical protein